jgi:hypothetical protein
MLPAWAEREARPAQAERTGRMIRVRSFLATLAIEAVTMEAASKAIPRLLNVLVNAVT